MSITFRDTDTKVLYGPLSAKPELRRPPARISFAGIDDKVEFSQLDVLNVMYDMVEFGVLIHPEKFGTKRYPSLGFIMQFQNFIQELNKKRNRDAKGIAGATLHICGDYVDEFFELGYFGIEHLLDGFYGIQVNCGHRGPLSLDDNQMLLDWSYSYKKDIIVQVQEFPKDEDHFTYLYDASRGKGIHPNSWPNPGIIRNRDLPTSRQYTDQRDKTPKFAGGISLETVYDDCLKISSMVTHYSIDMESGVRDSNNEFDIDKCYRICEVIYGKRTLMNGSLFDSEGNCLWDATFAGAATLPEEEEPEDGRWERLAAEAQHALENGDSYVDEDGNEWIMNEDGYAEMQ